MDGLRNRFGTRGAPKGERREKVYQTRRRGKGKMEKRNRGNSGRGKGPRERRRPGRKRRRGQREKGRGKKRNRKRGEDPWAAGVPAASNTKKNNREIELRETRKVGRDLGTGRRGAGGTINHIKGGVQKIHNRQKKPA